MAQPWNLYASYSGLLFLASASVYAGSYASLNTPREDNDSDSEDDSPIETLTATDAYMFPILGSGALVGLYFVFKFLSKEWINWFMGIYFAIMGVGSVWKTSMALVKNVLGGQRWRSFPKYTLKSKYFDVSFRLPTALLGFLSLLPSVLYSLTPSPAKKSALLTNILALSFSYTAFELVKLDGFRTGCILLTGLFIYDIWWVFGTEVMIKVATSLDAPVKILWSKSLTFSSSAGFTMLGLGDIVIPGTFIATCLRYDQHLYLSHSPASRRDTILLKNSRHFPKPYFRAAMFAYVSGLVTTMVVMHTFKAGQPALLYLSPACILAFVITALRRGGLSEAWAWRDNAEGEDTSNEERKGGASLNGDATNGQPGVVMSNKKID